MKRLKVFRFSSMQWRVIREREGLFLFSSWLRRGDVALPHCLGYNAGAGILYLGPYVEIVEEEDRVHLDVFAARIEAVYGIYLDDSCRCRQVWLNPRHSAALALSYNDENEIKRLRELPLSGAARRRLRNPVRAKKRKAKPGQSSQGKKHKRNET